MTTAHVWEMDTLYKAVQVDGTDFYTGTVQWLPRKRGKTMRPRTVRHPTSTEAVRGKHSTSLAVSTDPTRLPGSKWPLRLCVVEPVDGHPVVETDAHKRQATAWRVVAEVDPAIRFGLNGSHVVALIERVSRLTDGEVEKLDDAAGCAAWGAPGAAASDAARAAAWSAARAAASDAARDTAWSAARAAASDAARDTAWSTDAARAAARAMVVRDLITPQHYRTLTEPLRSVIGPLPGDDDGEPVAP